MPIKVCKCVLCSTCSVLTFPLGLCEGCNEGSSLGEADGLSLGEKDGESLGLVDGLVLYQ